MSSGEKEIPSEPRMAETTCRVLLVRHARAEGNGRFLGQQDAPLAPAGRRELPRLCEKCAAHRIHAVYSSDLGRARDTASAVARQFGLPVQLRPDLREMHFGEWQGLGWDEIERRDSRLAALWIERFPHHPIPGAESFREFNRRIAAELRRIVKANRGKCVLVVTHAGVIRFTLGKALGLPSRNLFRLAQDNCAMNIIDYLDSGAVVRCING